MRQPDEPGRTLGLGAETSSPGEHLRRQSRGIATTSATESPEVTYKVNTTSYAIDVSHSLVEFAVKYLMISTVKGHFRLIDFSQRPPQTRAAGMIVIDENDRLRSSVTATIDTATIDTGVEERDNDLRSEHFLDVEKYPTMTFKSTAVEPVDEDNWKLTGDPDDQGRHAARYLRHAVRRPRAGR